MIQKVCLSFEGDALFLERFRDLDAWRRDEVPLVVRYALFEREVDTFGFRLELVFAGRGLHVVLEGAFAPF